MGTIAAVAPIAMDACMLEKQFIFSRAADKSPDSECSFEPDKLARLCAKTRDAWLALGRAGFKRQKAEAGGKVLRWPSYL